MDMSAFVSTSYEVHS